MKKEEKGWITPGRQEVVGSNPIFSTNNTKPYSNVRLFLCNLSVLIECTFDRMSVKNEVPLIGT